MLLETMVSIFIRQYYFESVYEIKNRSGDSYVEIAVETLDEIFYCSFCVLDAKKQIFTVFCEHNTEKSYAYQLTSDSTLIDIKRELFCAREILMYISKDLKALQEIDAFLSDPYNVDLFYEKLTFCRGKYGNEWFVALNPMFEESGLDDLVLATTSVGMLWNIVDSRFTIHSGQAQTGQGAIECAHGVVSFNNHILFIVLNPEAKFKLTQHVPDKNSQNVIVYEGEIIIPNASGQGSECMYCKFTVSSLDQLPTTQVLVKLNDDEVKGKTPLLILNHPENGLLHSTLRQQSMNEAIDEMIEIVNEYVPRKFVQTYIEHLNKMCQWWSVSADAV